MLDAFDELAAAIRNDLQELLDAIDNQQPPPTLDELRGWIADIQEQYDG